jgi:hypothetical protein
MKKMIILFSLFVFINSCKTIQDFPLEDMSNELIYFNYDKQELRIINIFTKENNFIMNLPFKVDKYYDHWQQYEDILYLCDGYNIFNINIHNKTTEKVFTSIDLIHNFYIINQKIYLSIKKQIIVFDLNTFSKESIDLPFQVDHLLVTKDEKSIYLIGGLSSLDLNLYKYNINEEYLITLEFNVSILFTGNGEIFLYAKDYDLKPNSILGEDIQWMYKGPELRCYNTIIDENIRLKYALFDSSYKHYILNDNNVILQLPKNRIVTPFDRIRHGWSDTEHASYYLVSLNSKNKSLILRTNEKIEFIGQHRRQ